MLAITQYFSTHRQSSTIFMYVFHVNFWQKCTFLLSTLVVYLPCKEQPVRDHKRYTFVLHFVCIKQNPISFVLLLVSNYLPSLLQLVNFTKHEIQTNVHQVILLFNLSSSSFRNPTNVIHFKWMFKESICEKLSYSPWKILHINLNIHFI